MKPWEKYQQTTNTESPNTESPGPWTKYAQPSPEPGFSEKVGEAVRDVPRQAGMFARFGLEGLGNAADFLTMPLRAAYDPIADATGLPRAGTNLGGMAADRFGLPEPQTGLERVAGDVTRTMAGTGGIAGLAGKVASYVPGVSGKVVELMGSRPDLQMASAAGAGTGGGAVRESGGNEIAQFLGALAGGVAGGATLIAGQKAVGGIRAIADKLLGSKNLNAQIDETIERAISASGLKLNDLPSNVSYQLRQDIKEALRLGKLSPDATRRLADYRLIGATPTRANLTLDPAEVTQQRNLAKIGANSQDPSLQRLAQTQNQNNRVLINNLNESGAGVDPISASEKVIGSLAKSNEAAKGVIDTAYQAARGAQGRSAALDPSKFTQTASDLLDDALLGGKLPADVRNKLNQIASAKMPFTVDVAEQLKTRIGELQRATIDAAERKALGLVRQALDDTPLLEGQGQQAIDAFNKARAANRAWMQVVEKTPALQAVREGVEPDKFIQKFLVGSGNESTNKAVFNLSQQIKKDPEAVTAVKGAITNYLKTKALSGATDEVGNFSQSAYNKTISSIGERKLAMFFSPVEVQQLKAIGRVASYEQVQPSGSAVNNSNTATTLIGFLDRIGRKIPGVSELILDPVKGVATNIRASRSLNAPKSLLTKQPEARKLPPVLLPLFIEQQADN